MLGSPSGVITGFVKRRKCWARQAAQILSPPSDVIARPAKRCGYWILSLRDYFSAAPTPTPPPGTHKNTRVLWGTATGVGAFFVRASRMDARQAA